jgi:hypothetical protein
MKAVVHDNTRRVAVQQVPDAAEGFQPGKVGRCHGASRR